MRLQLVVNPAAGGGRGTRAVPAVRAALADQDLLVTLTTSLDHAAALARAAVADDRVVVAVGGDGLVGRVAGAVADAGGVLGVVPTGRGNDFCRSVGITRDALGACSVLTSGAATAIDLGDVDGVGFLGIASVGFDSQVQERILAARFDLGRSVYLAAALATVARWQPASFACSVDGVRLSFDGWSIAVANTGTYGGGMRLAPSASVTDGLLDVVATSTTTRRAFVRALPKVFTGRHVSEPSVRIRQGRTVLLDADRPFRVFADGEPVASLPCTVTVRPGALRVLLPRRPPA